jgi:hypothetical protein
MTCACPLVWASTPLARLVPLLHEQVSKLSLLQQASAVEALVVASSSMWVCRMCSLVHALLRLAIGPVGRGTSHKAAATACTQRLYALVW